MLRVHFGKKASSASSAKLLLNAFFYAVIRHQKMPPSCRLYWVIACFALGLAPVATAAPQIHRVLILDQGDLTNPFLIKHTLAIRAALTTDVSQPVEIYTEGLDIDRFPSQDHKQKLIGWLIHKYRDRKVDVIITEGPEALDFAIQFRSALGPTIPIVFTAIEEYFVGRMALPPEVTGVASISSFKDSVRLINAMMPNVRSIAVLGDQESQAGHLVDISRQLIQMQINQQLNLMIGMPVASLLSRVSSLPKDTVILYLGITIDSSTGQYFLPSELLATFAKAANRPIFVTNDSLMGYGAIGGLIAKSDVGVREVAEMTHRVLNGENASNISVRYRDARNPVFDSRVLKRWRISEDRLPDGSTLINEDTTLWEQYSVQIIIIISVVILQTALIVALILEHRRRRRAELGFRRSMSDLAHISRTTALGELSASIAHELNQPLAAILSNAEAADQLIAANPPAVAEARDALADIRRDDQRASDIILSMRSLFRKDGFNPKTIDINKVVGEVLRFVRWEARSKKVIVMVGMDKNLPFVAADEVQLKQVILNLLLNAIDAASNIAKEGEVTIAARHSGHNSVELSVEDTGPGIPAEMIDRIFDPYYTTKDHGMGMGLSICRTIIEAHGSRLNVHNIAGGGARFGFTLTGAK